MLNKIIFVISILYSIIYNIRIIGFNNGLKCPILFKIGTKISIKGQIQIKGNIVPYMIKIGFGGSERIYAHKSYFIIKEQGILTFNGKAHFSEGTTIRVENGRLSFGNNFFCNKNCAFFCDHKIEIKDDVLLGWNITFKDGDGHKIINTDFPSDKTTEPSITINKHVWIASHANILKETEIASDSIVAYQACVTKKFKSPNCLIGGIPAHVIKENIKWEI